MFIVWGKKHVYKKMGYVSDFCPLCRSVREFQLDRVGLAGHVYYISLSKGQLVGHAKKCLNCKTILSANPDLYGEVSKKLLEPGELQRLTFPNIHTHYAERLNLEQTIKHGVGSLSNDTRHTMLREPFILLNPAVEKRFSSTHIDMQTGLTVLAVFVLFPLLSGLGRKLMPATSGEIDLGLLVVGIAAIAMQGFLQTRRYFDSKIFPVLVPALNPLKPSTDEITALITELKKADSKFGKKVRVSALLERLGG